MVSVLIVDSVIWLGIVFFYMVVSNIGTQMMEANNDRNTRQQTGANKII